MQGFDYAKKHMGRNDDTVSVTKETLVLALPVRDAPLSMSLDKKVLQDGTGSKRAPSTDIKGGYGSYLHFFVFDDSDSPVNYFIGLDVKIIL